MRSITQSPSGRPCTGVSGHCSTAIVWTAGKSAVNWAAQILNIQDIEELISQIAVNLPLSYQNKQKILEAVTLEEQYEVLGAILTSETEILQIGQELQQN